MPTYSTSDLQKGMKLEIDGEPYLIVERNFRKPGKGQALYTLKLKNLIKQTVLERTYRSSDSLEGADVSESEVQYLYAQGDDYVFMDSTSFEQYELSKDQLDGADRFLKDGMLCSVTFWNGNPISIAPPNHVVLKVEYCEPSARGNTATNLSKPVTLETGAEISAPAFIEIGDLLKIDTRTGEYIERVKE
ncbi:Elongation factor P [Planctomycetales bacterium 10988]|nr:Elongation factor P [Planctomycetales bacterium 10988]